MSKPDSIAHPPERPGTHGSPPSPGDGSFLGAQTMTERQKNPPRQVWPPLLRVGLILLGFTAIVSAVGATAIMNTRGADQAGENESARPMPVSFAEITFTDGFEVSRRYTGIVEAHRRVDISTRVGGILREVAVDDGADVREGDRLAQLDTRPLEARRDELTAALRAADALLAELEQGPRDEAIQAARAEVAQSAARLARLELDLTRVQRAASSSAASESEVDRARFDRDEAQAVLNQGEQRLRELENGTRTERVAAQQAEVARIAATLAIVEVDIADSTLTAPFNGRIDRRLLDEGRFVGPGESVVRLVETSALEAWIGVPADRLSSLSLGSPATLLIGQREIRGTVGAIMPEVDAATRTVRVRFDLPPAADAVPGQIARLLASEHVEGRGAWLPREALAEGIRGLWSVYAIVPAAASPNAGNTISAGQGWRLERAEVELMHAAGDRAFVRTALPAGTRVVASGTHAVSPGIA
ncbi:MAG: efflux RND transporter periplasmic adaptor subunit, partial [Planctomycetota bacterium]